MTKGFKRQLIAAFCVLLVGLLIIALYRNFGLEGSTKNRNQLYQQLLERSGQLNRDLPKLLDTQTRFERAEVVDYGMRFIYTLVGVDKYRHDEDAIKAQLQGAMQQAFCSADSLAFYREHADFLVIRYLDQNEATLFELRFVAADCSA